MISIITPTYNRAHLISRAINSVLNQSIEEWELIIVDDGSTDNTAEVIKPFLSDERISYIRKENSGAANSRNVGVESSQYDWITFLDSDDEAKAEWIETYKNIISEKKSVSLICNGCEKISKNDEIIEIKMPKTNHNLFGNIKYKMTNGGVFTLKKKDFINIGGYDTKVKAGQHTELSFRLIPYLINKKKEIITIDKSLIKIHHHDGPRIRTNAKMKHEGALYNLNKHQTFFKTRKKAKSRYLGIVGVNLYLNGDKCEGIKYLWKSFLLDANLKNFVRFIRYFLTIR